MSSLEISGSDSGLVTQATQFKNAMNLYGATIGYDAAQIAEVVAATNAFPTSYNASEAAKNAATGAVASKNVQRAATISVMRDYAQRIKSNPEATPEILAAFGISPEPIPSGIVSVPTDLTSDAASNGTCLIKWDRNGNVQGTVFVIEFRYSTSEAWSIMATTTKSRFVDNLATPGTSKYYRVRAERGGIVSAYSGTTVIYPFLSESGLELAA